MPDKVPNLMDLERDVEVKTVGESGRPEVGHFAAGGVVKNLTTYIFGKPILAELLLTEARFEK